MPVRPLTLVSEQEYLSSQYEPDCEFEDGVPGTPIEIPLRQLEDE